MRIQQRALLFWSDRYLINNNKRHVSWVWFQSYCCCSWIRKSRLNLSKPFIYNAIFEVERVFVSEILYLDMKRKHVIHIFLKFWSGCFRILRRYEWRVSRETYTRNIYNYIAYKYIQDTNTREICGFSYQNLLWYDK